MLLFDDFFIAQKFGGKAMVWIIFSLSIMLFLMRIVQKGEGQRQGKIYVISNTIFLTVCILELIYMSVAWNITWFCDPNWVGWFWTVINFILFVGVIYNQYMYLWDALRDVFANGNTKCDMKLGIYSWLACLVCVLLFHFIFPAALPFIVLGFFVAQIIQIIRIFKSYPNNRKRAFLPTSIYLLGTLATVFAFFHLLMLIIAVVIIIFTVALIWTLVYGGGISGIGSLWKIFYRDGSSVDAEQTGIGPIGEPILREKS